METLWTPTNLAIGWLNMLGSFFIPWSILAAIKSMSQVVDVAVVDYQESILADLPQDGGDGEVY